MRYLMISSCLLLFAYPIQADDSIDVKGGFFGERDMNRDMFSTTPTKPKVKDSKPKVKPVPKEIVEDTFAIDSKEEFIKSATKVPEGGPKEMPKQGSIDRNQMLRDSAAVKQAAQSIERLKAMTAGNAKQNPLYESSEFYRDAIDRNTRSSKESEAQPEQIKVNKAAEPGENPRALGRQMIAPEQASADKARVSLIVRAEPVQHLDKQLALLEKLHKELGIEVERLIVADFDKVYLDYASRPVTEFIPKQRKGRVQYPRNKRELTRIIERGNLGDLYQLAEVEYRPQFLNSWGKMSGEKQQTMVNGKDDRQMEKLARSAVTRRSKRYAEMMTSMSKDDISEIETALDKGYEGKPEKVANVPESFRKMYNLELRTSDVEPMAPLLKRLGVTRSPAWVFHVGSEIHVFEGNYDPTTLLTTDGRLMIPKGR